jgi:hypothetical protein
VGAVAAANVRGQLVGMIRLARIAMGHATAALLDKNPPALEELRSVGRTLAALQDAIEDHASMLQSRTPTDLATTLAGVHLNADAEDVGRLTHQVADIARSRAARSPIPWWMHDLVRRMGETCLKTMASAEASLDHIDAHGTSWLEHHVAEVHRLDQALYQRLLTADGVDIDAAIDTTLSSRCFARCADDAMSMSRHAGLLVGPPSS